MAKLTKESQYMKSTEEFCNWILSKAPKTPKKLVFLSKWGSLRHAANVAFICLQVCDLSFKLNDSNL
jgi:hypothetical protein